MKSPVKSRIRNRKLIRNIKMISAEISKLGTDDAGVTIDKVLKAMKF